MKKNLITILFVLGIIGLALLCIYEMQKQNTESVENKNTKSEATNVMTGEITEIIGSNEVFIEITKERGGLFLGDIVKVKYEIMLLDKLIIPDMPQLGDVISLIYVEDDLQEENSDDLQYVVETKEVYKHVSDNIVKIQIAEIIGDNTVAAKVIDEDYDDDSKLEVTYKEFIVAGNKENSYETNKGKVAVGDEVLIRYADENIIQREDKVVIECEYMVK